MTDINIDTNAWLDALNERHKAAAAEIAKRNASGINIHGKKYTTVAVRVECFRTSFGCYGRLRIAEHTEDLESGRMMMRAVIELWTPQGWVEFAEGRAEEVRGSTAITKTSAVEVCETSAYGRALANFGLHGGEFASANEVQNAVTKQNGWNHKPMGDTEETLSAKLYASNFAAAFDNDDVLRAQAIHADLHEEGEEAYRNAWALLDSKVRTWAKKAIAAKSAA